MKLKISNLWFRQFFAGRKRSEKLRQLQLQRCLQHLGIEATAEIMEASTFDDEVGSFLPVRLWLKLKRSDGTFIYTHTNTLVNFKKLPVKGETVKIKYSPGDLSTILIL